MCTPTQIHTHTDTHTHTHTHTQMEHYTAIETMKAQVAQ